MVSFISQMTAASTIFYAGQTVMTKKRLQSFVIGLLLCNKNSNPDNHPNGMQY